MRSFRPLLLILLITVLVLAAWQILWQRGHKAVVLYCAHDAVFADGVLRAFTARTGIPVSVRFDTEATKSLGLVERLIAQAETPECDVFWNNEQLGTMDLARRGLLDSHKGSGWQRIPAAFRDADGRWTGFAARMRVVIDNYSQEEIASASFYANDPHTGTIAKPLFGTTLTHYCALWQRYGADAVKQWHATLRRDGLREVDGNALVRRLVADQTCRWGYSDTDDAFEALDAGKAINMQPARVQFFPNLVSGPANNSPDPTIVIPNTVAVIRGAPHLESARLLADFLASAEVEVQLARSTARQIPLGPVDESQVPEQVRALRSAAAEGLPLAGLLEVRDQVLAWLKQEYAR